MKATEQLIEERNELAKAIYLKYSEATADNAVESANNLMAAMYGPHWNGMAPLNENPAPAEENYTYSLTPYDHNGETWLRVQALGEDFIIAPHDLDGGKSDFDYDAAMARLKELNLSTFNKRQLFIVGTLIEEINAKLEEIGGDEFAKDWYISSELYKPVGSCADYSASSAWYFDPDGVLTDRNRYYTDFRSRPSLALPLPN